MGQYEDSVCRAAGPPGGAVLSRGAGDAQDGSTSGSEEGIRLPIEWCL